MNTIVMMQEYLEMVRLAWCNMALVGIAFLAASVFTITLAIWNFRSMKRKVMK